MVTHKQLLYLSPSQVFVKADEISNTTIYLFPQKPGKTDISLEIDIKNVDTQIDDESISR